MSVGCAMRTMNQQLACSSRCARRTLPWFIELIRASLEAVAAIIIRSQPKTEYPAGRILKYQLGPVSNKGILCNGAGLRAVQADDVVFGTNCPVDAGLNIQQPKPVAAHFKYFTGTAVPTAIQI